LTKYLLLSLILLSGCATKVKTVYIPKPVIDHNIEGQISLDENRINDALYHLKKSADDGNRYDMYKLGKLYMRLDDYSNAFQYLEKCTSISTDGSLPGGSNKLASLYYKGLGVKQNYEKAFYYYNQSMFINDSIIMLANMNEFGIGVDKNLTKAYSLYKYLVYLEYSEYEYKVTNISEQLSSYSKEVANSELYYYKMKYSK